MIIGMINMKLKITLEIDATTEEVKIIRGEIQSLVNKFGKKKVNPQISKQTRLNLPDYFVDKDW